MPTRPLIITLAIAAALYAGYTVAVADDVVATVNGVAVTNAQLKDYGLQREELRAGDASKEQLIGELVNKELVYQAAIKEGVDKSAELAQRMEMLRRELIIATALSDWSKANPVTDEEIKAVYDEAVAKNAQDEYKARHILLENEAEAIAVIAELDGGADFAELAKTKSTGPSGPQGGDLGWFRDGAMVAPFSAAAKKMEKGSYSKTPVKTQFGWHVILLEDTRPLAPPPLDQVRGQIADTLEQLKVQTNIGELRDQADIVEK